MTALRSSSASLRSASCSNRRAWAERVGRRARVRPRDGDVVVRAGRRRAGDEQDAEAVVAFAIGSARSTGASNRSRSIRPSASLRVDGDDVAVVARRVGRARPPPAEAASSSISTVPLPRACDQRLAVGPREHEARFVGVEELERLRARSRAGRVRSRASSRTVRSRPTIRASRRARASMRRRHRPARSALSCTTRDEVADEDDRERGQRTVAEADRIPVVVVLDAVDVAGHDIGQQGAAMSAHT